MKNNYPLVSVIVVCYNHEKFIDECIDSIMHQSYTNIEVFVFDNGSTDNSPFILNELQVKYKFKLYFQENIGVPRALNKAIKMVKGKYISPMSTDDFWPLDKIEIEVDFMENCDNNIALCGGNAIIIDENSNIFRKQTFAPYHEIDFNDVFLDGKNIPALTSMIRKEIISEVCGYDVNIQGEDYLMWLKITSRGYKIAFLNNLLGFYRRHSYNMSHNAEARIQTLKYCIDAFKKHPKHSIALRNLYFRLFLLYAKINRKLAIRFLLKIKYKQVNKQFFFALSFFILPKKITQKITNAF